MASPLRLLATPKYKFPITPLRQVKSCENLVSHQIEKSLRCETGVRPNANLTKNYRSVKRLDFSESGVENFTQTSGRFSQQRNLPQIKINWCSSKSCKGNKKSVLINTPEKQKLLACGLQNKNSFRVIGIGSFGTVIHAIYKDANVAVKITKPASPAATPETYMVGLEHKNIIKTLDVVFGNNHTYCLIIMEYIANTVALSSVLEDKSVNLKSVTVKMAKDVAEGLQYLHENNLIHLDVKPANVLVCPTGLCKLCDFGSCYKTDSGRDEIYKHKGTVIYTAPEILLGKTPTFKSDVYSLGILMWQLITRELPFSDIDKSEVLIYKVVKYKLRPDTTKCENNAYSKLFCECWEADFLARPEVSDVIEKLEQIEKL